MHSAKYAPTTRSDGVSRRFRVALIAFLVVASVYVVIDVVTDGLGKSTVGPMLALIVGVLLWFRERESGTSE
jgi:hypothetical protein